MMRTAEKKDKKFIAVELIPPFNTDDEKLLESAHYLKNAGVDVLTFPDSPSGRTRVDSVLMAAKVYRETGIDVMPHVCCRDKNAFAMRAMFMGAKINDIKNFLIITGDPVPASARDLVKSVFNFSSVGLMKIAQEMNREVFNENPLNYGGAINQEPHKSRINNKHYKEKNGRRCKLLPYPACIFKRRSRQTQKNQGGNRCLYICRYNAAYKPQKCSLYEK